MAEQQPVQSHSGFQTALFREIYKNSWLKRVPSNPKKKKERLWVVFCVHDDTNPFLETYVDNKIAVLHKPDWFISLNCVQHITTTICSHEQDYEFVITLNSDSVRLAAPSWDIMLEWVESLRGKLNELKILHPKENVYSKLPESRGVVLLPTRDPTSPLPPPPISNGYPHLVEDSETNVENSIGAASIVMPAISSRRRTDSTSSCDSFNTARSLADMSEIFNFENFLEGPPLSAPPSIVNSSHYEHVFQIQQSPGPSTREVEFQRLVNIPTRILQPPPRPYKTLREQQVLQLQNEIKHPGGVRLQLRRRDCITAIALVDAFDSVWISGWKQKEHPMLYNALHIGDEIVSIEGVTIKTAYQARRLLKEHSAIYVNIIIRRVPHGEVYVIHREAEGQSLGIVQENNTAVIECIEANSLAARHGLTSKAKACDGSSFTNWVLTEINGRPLNLFFKKNQVRDRLNAVGRDISILVQPLDLIKHLKKELKSIRYYKDYLLQ